MKTVLKKVVYFLGDHLLFIAYTILLCSVSALGIIAFQPSGKKAGGTVASVIVASFVISILIFLVGSQVWPIEIVPNKEKVLELLIIACILIFLASSLLLPQFVFVKSEKHQSTTPYDVAYEVKEDVCYVADTGDCYHKKGCRYLLSETKLSLTTAKARGYRPCSYCWSDYRTEHKIEYKTQNHIETTHNYTLSYAISFVVFFGLSIMLILLFRKAGKKEFIELNKDDQCN